MREEFMKSKHAALWFAVAGLAFFALAASSPQCARTSETLGPSLDSQAASSECSQACIDAYHTAKKAEQVRFKVAMNNCNGNPECRETESDLHESIVDELAADKDACIANCAHEQGAGTGGQ